MNYYNEIKNELINNEINRKVKNHSTNKSDLNTYCTVGKILSEAGKYYGEGIIKEYSKRLTIELGKGYSKRNLSVRQLSEKIKSNEYKRLPEVSKNKFISKEKLTVVDFVKNPILIRNSNNYKIISVKILQKLILEDIESFMK